MKVLVCGCLFALKLRCGVKAAKVNLPDRRAVL